MDKTWLWLPADEHCQEAIGFLDRILTMGVDLIPIIVNATFRSDDTQICFDEGSNQTSFSTRASLAPVL